MSLLKYDTFLEVVRTMNMSKAAENTHQAVSGVSYAIAKVEEELGVSLLVRGHGGLALTDAGAALLPYIESMLHGRDRLMEQAGLLSGADRGVVKVGGLFSAVMRFIPGILRKMNELYPDIEVQMILNPYEQLSEDLTSGVIDVALAGAFPHIKSLEFTSLMQDEYRVIVSDDHYLYGRETLTLAELRGEKLILPEWGIYDKDFHRLISESGIERQVYCKLREERTIVSMARSGLGTAILTGLMIPEGERFQTARLLDWPSRSFGSVTREGTQCPPAARRFLECTRLWMEEKGLLS